MIRPKSIRFRLPSSPVRWKKISAAPSTAPMPSQNNRTAVLGHSGTIVLSSTFQLLFINSKAIELIGWLEPHRNDRRLTLALPDALMKVAQEIATTCSTRTQANISASAMKYRLRGPSSQSIQVRGFSIPCHEGEDRRIVLVLSRADKKIAP